MIHLSSTPSPVNDSEVNNYKGDVALVLVLLVLACLLRLDFLHAGNYRIDADEAIVGLMAKHILEGLAFPVFYYGQHYMGSFEAFVVAFSFSLFGVSTWALKIVPLFFSLLLIPLIYGITRELASRRAARLACLFAALPPATLVVWSGKARGGFIETLCIGALALLLCIRWLKNSKLSMKHSFVIGLILGFGWWVNNQILYFMLPIGYVMLAHCISIPTQFLEGRARIYHVTNVFLLGCLGFLIGGLPYWIYNIKNEFRSLEMFRTSGGTGMLDHAAGLFSTAFPILFGAKRYWQRADIFPYSTRIAWLIYGGLFAYLLFRQRSEILRLCLLKSVPERPFAVLIMFVFATCLIFTGSSFGYLVEAPRYLLPLYVAIPVLLAIALEELRAQSRILSLLLLICLLSLNLLSSYLGGRAIPGEPFVHKQERVSRNHSELIARLQELNIDWIRTNYWIGYRLAFETNEKVRFLVFSKPGQVRIQDYEDLGAKKKIEQLPLLLVPSQAEAVRQALALQGYRFEETRISGYQLLYGIEPSQQNLIKLGNDQFILRASHSAESTEAAIDEDLNTRWGSSHRQVPGMYFAAELKPPRRLRGLHYDLGPFWHDYPRSLTIEIELDDGSIVTLLDEASYASLRYHQYGNTSFSFYFESLVARKVIFKQVGEDVMFDWSIAEFELFY